MSRISLILHETEMKPRPSVNIKDILRMQMGFNCLNKGIMLLMLPTTCKWFNKLLLIYINALWLDAYVNIKPLRCINTLWLGVYVRYTSWNMLDIPQQNPLKCGFSGIEKYIHMS